MKKVLCESVVIIVMLEFVRGEEDQGYYLSIHGGVELTPCDR